MNRWRQHSLDLANAPVLRPEAQTLSLSQRVGQMHPVENDQAFIRALDETNRLPIPNDLALSIHLPNEKSSGCAPQKWGAPLSEQIRRLSSRFDQDRQVHELHIHIDQIRPIATLIQYLIGQVESHFVVADDALLSLFVPVGVSMGHVLIQDTAFNHVHLDYFFEKPDDLERSLPQRLSPHSKHTTIGITLKAEIEEALADAPMDSWLTPLINQHPDRLLFESFEPRSEGYQNLLYTRPDASVGLKQLKENGYQAIGSGAFVRPNCPLAKAYQKKCLGLGLSGYLTRASLDQLGIGPDAMSWVGDYVASNHSAHELYARMLEKGHAPIAHGLALQPKDVVNQAVIDALICDHALSIDQIQRRFLVCFRKYFPKACLALQESIDNGFLHWHGRHLEVTDLGLAYLPAIVSPWAEPAGLIDASGPKVVHIN